MFPTQRLSLYRERHRELRKLLPRRHEPILLSRLQPQFLRISKCVVTSDMCRVAMYISTSYRSGLTLEAWLPTNWTRRFLTAGNGGVSGCLQYTDLAYTAGLGFATVG
jgi:hypothetical protein